MDKHTEELDKLITKVVTDYAKDNKIKFMLETDYGRGTIKIKCMSNEASVSSRT